jgi:Domain of unknown function (DUF4232)
MLRRKADDVNRQRAVPGELTRRVRVRVARNVSVVGIMLVLLGAGAFVGARTLNPLHPPRHIPPASHRTEHPPPRVSPTPHASTTAPTTSTVSPSACSAGQLRAVGATLGGAAGNREGAITVSNYSDATCTLQGRPTITLLNQNLKPITSGVIYDTAPAGWEVNGSPAPPGWPVVTIAPGQDASFRIRWSNWCPDGRPAPLWQLGVPQGNIDVNGFDTLLLPPCNGPGQPSTIEVGPFEPNVD